VATENENIIGWAALTPVSDRCVYGGVAEISIYVAYTARGRGVGKKLLRSLIESSEANRFWTLQAGIFPENIASIKIHEANGFRVIGKREKIGQMNGVWRDTLLLERRSKIVGI
jgi:phosphinothricin acetyltransferase